MDCLVAMCLPAIGEKSPTPYLSRIGDKKMDAWEPNADTSRGPTDLLLPSRNWGFLMVMHQTHLTAPSHLIQLAGHGQRRLPVNPTRHLRLPSGYESGVKNLWERFAPFKGSQPAA